MSVRRRLFKDGFSQIQRFDNRVRAQIEFRLDDFRQAFVVQLTRPVRIDEYRYGACVIPQSTEADDEPLALSLGSKGCAF